MDISLQFEPWSVYERIKALNDSGPTNEELIILRHQLKSALFSAIHNGDLFLLSPEEPNPTIHQRVYVELLALSARQTVRTIDELLAPLKDKADIGSLEIKIGGLSRELVAWLQTAATYLPATEAVMQVGTLSTKRQDCLQCLDFYYGLAFYVLNLQFAHNLRRSPYRLQEDINDFWSFQSTGRYKPPITLEQPDIPHIESNADYFSKVILPLINNIYQHAFNHENDITGRLQDNQLIKKYKITSYDDEGKREIVVTVTDNGLGINPKIQDRVFQRYTPSESGPHIQHGIGLSSVKNFVEKNGGRIWFETILGEGTSFHFTIPYREKQPITLNTFVYRQ